MKNLKKLSLLCLALTVMLATGCGCDKKDTKKEENTSKDPIANTNEEVIKDQEINGLTFTNTSLVYENGSSTLVTEVTNNTDSDYALGDFYIIVKDADGNEMIKLLAYAGETIPAGESRTVNAGTDMDLTSAASIEYTEVVK